jgi:hypothetical protein
MPDSDTEVPAQSLPHHLRAGWEQFEPPPPPPYVDPDDKQSVSVVPEKPSAKTTEPEKKPALKKTPPKEGDV